jgi:hypothetical protein
MPLLLEAVLFLVNATSKYEQVILDRVPSQWKLEDKTCKMVV